jgi:hypothetical protein
MQHNIRVTKFPSETACCAVSPLVRFWSIGASWKCLYKAG